MVLKRYAKRCEQATMRHLPMLSTVISTVLSTGLWMPARKVTTALKKFLEKPALIRNLNPPAEGIVLLSVLDLQNLII